MDYYKILGVPTESSIDDIKKAYRKLVKEHHPDASGGDDTKFKEIAEAYEILGDSDKRKKYDNIGNTKRVYADRQYKDAWSNYFSDGDFSNMFNNAFGGNATKGEDIKVSISITLEECYHGTRRYIDIGNGGFNINIPKGIPNGTKLKVKGRGAISTVGVDSEPGDMILTINILHDLEIIVNGSDIYIDLQLNWIDLILGGDFEVKNKLNNVIIKVPQGSYDSKFLRVNGKGMPLYNKEGFGSLYVKLRTLDIILNDNQIELLKRIKSDI